MPTLRQIVDAKDIKCVIVKTKSGYIVKSHDKNKTLSKPMSKEKAVERLRQIEYFKHKGK